MRPILKSYLLVVVYSGFSYTMVVGFAFGCAAFLHWSPAIRFLVWMGLGAMLR